MAFSAMCLSIVSVASASHATPICVSTVPAAARPLVVAERYLNRSASWQASNLCCKAGTCSWVDPATGAQKSAPVALARNGRYWLVRDQGRVCYVTPLPSGAYKTRCVRSG